MCLACLQALLAAITYCGSRKGRIGSAVGIGGSGAEAFTTTLVCLSGIVRYATRFGLCRLKVRGAPLAPMLGMVTPWADWLMASAPECRIGTQPGVMVFSFDCQSGATTAW